MGIRSKIFLGFLCLAIMLLFSSMISLFELNKMSSNTTALLEHSSQSMELSKTMLDAVQEQNTSLLQTIVLKENAYDSVFLANRILFEAALVKANTILIDGSDMQGIYNAKNNYYKLTDSYMADHSFVSIEWFVDMYKTYYHDLTTAIKDYMMLSQEHLMNRASRLKNNAYRAITPGVITLGVAVIMIFVFAFLIDMYYTKPIFDINSGLSNYINHKTPFSVKMEGKDEVFKLKEHIEQLISMYKNKKV